jgi:hypothetical protein
MTIKDLLNRFDITQASLGKELGYTTYAGVYRAINNPKQQVLIKSYLKEKILRERGVDIDKMIEGLK